MLVSARKLALISGLIALAMGAFAMPASAQVGGPNSQLLCYTLAPPVNQRFSPGLNRGTAEDQWILCQAVIDGNAFNEADEAGGSAGNGEFLANFVVPTYTDRNHANGINNLSVEGLFGDTGNFEDIDGNNHDETELPAGHPALTMDVCGNTATGCVLGAFGDGDDANMGDVTVGAPVFSTGPNLFPNDVTGVRIPFTMDNFDTDPESRIDVFFAIRLARDHLKYINDYTTPASKRQGFPGEEDGNGGSPDGAGQYFSGPGPLWIGFFTGSPTGIATVPIKVTDLEETISQSSIEGFKYCDADASGDCSGENLVDGTTINVRFCLDPFGIDPDGGSCNTVQNVNDISSLEGSLVTGANFTTDGDDFSQAVIKIKKQGPNIIVDTANTTEIVGSAGDGQYTLTFERNCATNGNGDGGGDLILRVAEVLDASIFDVQTAPEDDADNSDGVTASGGEYIVELGCEDDVTDLNFGNVALEPSDADPMTMGFWGQLVKKAIHTDGGEGAEAQCGDAAPGGDTLPHSGYTTPAEVAAVVDGAADGCAAFDSTINADTEVEDLLCDATAILPPGKDGSLGGTNNAISQLLAFLMNIESGKLPGNNILVPGCDGIPGDLPEGTTVGDIAAAACSDPEAYHDLLDAINNLDPGDECLVAPTCPDDDKVTDSLCAI